jgi:hypothetical protein
MATLNIPSIKVYDYNIYATVNFYLNLTNDDRKVNSTKIRLTWDAKITNGNYIGSSGLMFRYKIHANGAWSNYYSLIGNANYPDKSKNGVSGYTGYKFTVNTLYSNGYPYYSYWDGGTYPSGSKPGGYNSAWHECSVSRGASDTDITYYFEIVQSLDMHNMGSVSSYNQTITIPSQLYYWDINIYDPNGKQGVAQNPPYTVGTFDEYINNIKQNNQPLNNELPSKNYQPYWTWVSIDNFNFMPQYQLKKDNNGVPEVYNGTGGARNRQIKQSEDPYRSNRWGHRITGYNDDLYVYTDWKKTTLSFNYQDDNINPTIETRTMQYTKETDDAPIPTRIGYKFLGWYTTPGDNEDGVKIFNADGSINSEIVEFWQNNKYQKFEDIIIYARWKVQNITYIKTEDGWKLATVYIKDNNEWKPAIMYVKTEDGWKQSITK